MGLAPSELGIDFLILGMAVITADKHVARQSQAEDSWTRQLGVGIPVSDPDAWASVAPRLAEALGFLTGDKWSFAFRPRPEEFATLAHGYKPARAKVDCISLLSGGLDSFIGSIDLMAAGRSVMFVSHSASRTDSSRQRHLVDALARRFGSPVMHLRGSILVEHQHLVGTEDENTERSRSFLFFALTALAASALPDVNTVVVPENGLISLNIPLEDLRLGSLSTRTTHPYFLARMNEILGALGYSARLANPYQFLTKGDMVRGCRDTAFLAAELSG